MLKWFYMIPKWIYAVASLIAFVGLLTGAGVYFFPTTFLPGVDFSSEPTKVLAHLWATRQIAIAAVIGYALAKRSVATLQAVLLVYALVTLLDIFVGVVDGDLGLAAISAVFSAISFAAILSLQKVITR